jgi:hypothetical protein
MRLMVTPVQGVATLPGVYRRWPPSGGGNPPPDLLPPPPELGFHGLIEAASNWGFAGDPAFGGARGVCARKTPVASEQTKMIAIRGARRTGDVCLIAVFVAVEWQFSGRKVFTIAPISCAHAHVNGARHLGLTFAVSTVHAPGLSPPICRAGRAPGPSRG